MTPTPKKWKDESTAFSGSCVKLQLNEMEIPHEVRGEG
jgi:hypothetical protein